MSRSRLILIALLLISTGAFLYFLPREPDRSPAVSPAGGHHPGKNTAAAWPPRKELPPELFTFEHEGKTVTLDLAGVRHAHRFLQRVPAEPGAAGASAPDFEFDFLHWPGRKFTGNETIKTHRCWVVDFTNPAKTGPHMVVRLFVDQETGSLMRLYAFNFDGKRSLDYSVKSAMRVEGAMAVKTASARHLQPGTSKVEAEVEYLAQSPGKP